MKLITTFLKSKFIENSYFKNVIVLMFGSGMAQVIPFVFSIILARLYSEENFGMFTLFSTIVTFLSVIATMRYEISIMLPKKHIDAFHIVVLCFLISTIVSILIFIGVISFPASISKLIKSPDIKPWLFLLPIGVFLTGFIQSLNIWFNRQKRYKRLSSAMVIQSSTTATVNTSNGFVGFTSAGLIVGSLSGQLIASLVFAISFLKSYKRLLYSISWKRIKYVAKKYSEYPKFNFPHRLVDMISITGLPLLITTLFSSAVLGWYGFMLRILQAPVGILASSLGQVYFQQFSEQVANGKTVRSLFIKTVSRVAILISPFFIVIIIWGPDIFSYIFSEKWRNAGVYAQYLAPWLLVSAITSPVSQTPITLGYVKTNMFIGFFNNVLMVSIFFIFAKLYGNIEHVFMMIGIIMPIYFLAILYWYYKIIDKYESNIRQFNV